MSFDLIRLIFMAISIVLGGIVGGFLGSFIGVSGGIFGAVIVGVGIYIVYSFLASQPISIVGAIVFGLCNWISTFIMGFLGNLGGFGVGIVGLLIQASILSLVWGWVGAKAQSGVKTGLTA